MIILITIYTTWKVLGIITLILLIVFWKSKGAVWGGLTIGIIVGFISNIFRQGGFDWHFIAKFVIIGALIGIMAELLSKVANKLKNK